MIRLYTPNGVWAYQAIISQLLVINNCIGIFKPNPYTYNSIAFIVYKHNVDRIRHVAHRASAKQNRQGKTRYDIK